MSVSKTNGTPKWTVEIRENPIQMDDLGYFPIFQMEVDGSNDFPLKLGAFLGSRGVVFFAGL